MKRNCLSWLVLIILICVYSCGNKGNTNYTEALEINLSKKPLSKNDPNSYIFSQFFNHVKGFQLDFKGGLLGNIYKVLSTKNLYLMVDRTHSNSIQVYDKAGHFKYVIKSIGKGPGEYVRIQDCCVDREILYVYDLSQSKVISFNVNTGSFIKERRLNIKFAGFEKKDGFTYYYTFYSKDTDYWLIIEDDDTKKRTGFFPYSEYKFKNLAYSVKPFFKSNDHIIFYLSHMYTFYKLERMEVKPYIDILPKPSGKFESMLNETEYKKITMMELMKYGIIAFQNFYEDDRLLCFDYIDRGKIYSLIYNKLKNDYEIQKNLYDDITHTNGTLFYDYLDNKTIKIIDPANCLWLKKLGVDTAKAKITSKETFYNFDIDGNPIITINSYQ